MKRLLIISSLFFSVSAQSQVLFTYGNKNVTKEEFLTAFNKTPDSSANRKQALREYLDLYTNYKLKVQAAYDAGLNKDESYKLESENFQKQIAESFINKEANIDALVDEAYERSKKDIHVAHIFIEVKQPADSVAAAASIQKAYAELKSGKPFNAVSNVYTTDATTKSTNGDLGFVTVFSLPYDIESIIYQLKDGAISAPYRSNFGYHIFKKIAERPALGKRKIRQILLFTPKHFTESEKLAVSKKADSVYAALQNGADFTDMLKQFGNNYNQYNPQSGSLTVSVGSFEPAFEAEVYALKKAGDITKPFVSEYGYNIIRLEEVQQVGSKEDEAYLSTLKDMVMRDERLTKARKAKIAGWTKKIGLKSAAYNTADLWAFTDSVMVKNNFNSYKQINPETVLFSFPKQNYQVANWMKFVRSSKQSGQAIASKPYAEQFSEFINICTEDYYRNHLIDYNKEFARQVQEFNEANLLFAIMDKQVWTKAANDSAGLKKYYQQNASKYVWKPGVSAIVITAKTENQAMAISNTLKDDYTSWRDVLAKYEAEVIADSSRFEMNQLPVKQEVKQLKGWVAEPEKNSNDGSFTFIVITAVHDKAEPRSFDEARGLIINEYQTILEAEWIKELRKKYPIKVNEQVMQKL